MTVTSLPKKILFSDQTNSYIISDFTKKNNPNRKKNAIFISQIIVYTAPVLQTILYKRVTKKLPAYTQTASKSISLFFIYIAASTSA
jgi:hypothetical protein